MKKYEVTLITNDKSTTNTMLKSLSKVGIKDVYKYERHRYSTFRKTYEMSFMQYIKLAVLLKLSDVKSFTIKAPHERVIRSIFD